MKQQYRSSFLVLAVVAALSCGLLAQVSTYNSNQPAASSNSTPANTGTKTPAAAVTDPNYVVGPEDVLHINVWKEPELSGTVPVRPDGKISLALLNDIQAAGLTPMQLTEELTDKLKKYVTQPQVTVIVTGVNSRKVYVLGEVNRAGAIPLQSDMTVLQALSTVGGFSPFANLKGIYVLRQNNGKPQRHSFNYKEVIKGQNAEQNIVLKPGDTIVVP